MIFCRATTKDWLEAQKVLDKYEAVACQGINKHKLVVFFSSNIGTAARTSILSISWVAACNNAEKYLGLPLLVGQNKY